MPGAQPVRAGVLEAGLRIQCRGTTRVWGVGKEVRSRRTWTLAKGEGRGLVSGTLSSATPVVNPLPASFSVPQLLHLYM